MCEIEILRILFDPLALRCRRTLGFRRRVFAPGARDANKHKPIPTDSLVDVAGCAKALLGVGQEKARRDAGLKYRLDFSGY
jgi:hypothetical protein